MSGIATMFFTIGSLMFVWGAYFILSIKKPGVYPPKYILKRRAASLIMSGTAFLLLSLIIHSFR